MPEALQNADELVLERHIGLDRPVEQVSQDHDGKPTLVGDGDTALQLADHRLRPDDILASARTPRAHMRIPDHEDAVAGDWGKTISGQDHAVSRSDGVRECEEWA